MARSVLAETVEGEVGRLLKLLMVSPDATRQLADMAAQMQGHDESVELEKEKNFAIAHAKEAMSRAKKLYLQVEICEEE